MSTEKVLEVFVQFGLAGVILFFLGLFAFLVCRWVGNNIVKPMVDAKLKRDDAESASRIDLEKKTGEFMSAMQSHANNEEKIMNTIVQTQVNITETLKRFEEKQK